MESTSIDIDAWRVSWIERRRALMQQIAGYERQIEASQTMLTGLRQEIASISRMCGILDTDAKTG